MPYTDTAKNAMLNHLATLVTYASLHTADPGTTGTSEVTGGTYARKPVTWSAAAAGNLDSSNQPVFDVAAGVTVSHVGFWSALTAGTFYGSSALGTAETFGNAGTFTLTDADLSIT